MGPLMLDCAGLVLSSTEADRLRHPLTGGVILFARNYDNVTQLTELVKSIRQAANKPLLIAVDHEGGRVQRFREGFTRLPAMGAIQTLTNSEDEAKALAYACGVIMAYELKRIDIDMSFAPVLDINGVSNVIGDRGFAHNAAEVRVLAEALIDGMHAVGMPTTGKHFPGHGSVVADSHVAIPVDERSLAEIEATDLPPFKTLIAQQRLDAMMPAHVIFPQVDDKPAGFSSRWLGMLRHELHFDGVIFSDDLSMEGASVAGGYANRARAALSAGCDMVLACNNPEGAEAILNGLEIADAGDESGTDLNNQRLLRLANRPLTENASAEYARACALWEKYDN